MIYINGLGQTGRLGNQMFQYAALVGITKNLGYDFRIPDHRKNPRIVEKLFPDAVIYHRHELHSLFEMSHLADRFGVSDVEQISDDYENGFDQTIFDSCPDNVTLNGYFPSYKYFQNVEQELRQDFTIKEDILKAARKFHSNTWYPVCISVRRGDFLNFPTKHPVCDAAYYQKCIDIIGRDRQYVVTSDDIEWCKQTFVGDNFIFQDAVVDRLDKPWFDFAVASLCDDFIISASTFSWWAAWLGRKEGKRILVPDPWYGPEYAHWNADGFYPPGFERVSR